MPSLRRHRTQTPPQLAQGATSTVQPATVVKGQAAWGAWIIISGLLTITAIFGLALLRFDTAADVATAVGSVSGVIAALVGAYFGIRGASLGQAQAMQMMMSIANSTTNPLPPQSHP